MPSEPSSTSTLKRQVAEGYDRLGAYDQDSIYYVNTLRAMRELTPLTGPFLDVGCGGGSLLQLLAREHPADRGVGVDLASGVLAEALRKGVRGLAVGDAESLPFRDASFRTVFLMATLERTPDPLAALRETRRVLHPEGWVMVTAANAVSARLLKVKGVLTLGLRRYRPLPQPCLHAMTYGRLLGLIRDAGLEAVATRRAGNCPTRLLEAGPWAPRFGKHLWFLCRPARSGGVPALRILPDLPPVSEAR